MTIFVGPNHSGKSLVLRELIEGIGVPNGATLPEWKICQSVRSEAIPFEVMRSYVRARSHLVGRPSLMLGQNRSHVDLYPLSAVNETSHQQAIGEARAIYCKLHACLLDGSTRLTVTNDVQARPLNEHPNNITQALLADDSKRKTLRDVVYVALGRTLLIDPTNMPHLRFVIAEREPPIDVELSLSHESASFFLKHVTHISKMSDGFRAYVGLMAGVLSTEFSAILIDEPEAFLHPPLARDIGVNLGRLAAERGAQVLASTHSAHFLAGAIHSGAPTSIVRLTFEGGVGRATMIQTSRLNEMMRKPLMRSTGALSALFYRSAIVCESDTDRAFYDEINERLLGFSSGGIRDTTFLNAQNWSTMPEIVRPLREMGIPTAMVADLDVLLNDNFKTLLDACSIPASTNAGWCQTRSRLIADLKERVSAVERDQIKERVKADGLAAFGPDREAVDVLCRNLEEFGIFLVPVGEIERWLLNLNANGHGPKWLVSMFESMGSDPRDSSYVKPDDHDVWRFVDSIARWIDKPNRLGMP